MALKFLMLSLAKKKLHESYLFVTQTSLTIYWRQCNLSRHYQVIIYMIYTPLTIIILSRSYKLITNNVCQLEYVLSTREIQYVQTIYK